VLKVAVDAAHDTREARVLRKICRQGSGSADADGSITALVAEGQLTFYNANDIKFGMLIQAYGKDCSEEFYRVRWHDLLAEEPRKPKAVSFAIQAAPGKS